MIDPFKEIYDKCNSGTNEEKYASLPDFPDLLDIEITNRCNLRCAMCPTGRGELTRKKGRMEGNLFVKILQEIEPYKTPLRFIGWGEPTSVPYLCLFIAVAKRMGIKCHLNTNGHLITKENAEFMNKNLDSIKLSFHDSLSVEKYTNIIHMNNVFKHFSMTSDEITLCHISEEWDKVSKIRTFWRGRIYPRLKNCPEVFNKMMINWDGKVSACCADYDNFMVVGDLNDQTIKEIWLGEEMEKYRKLIVNNEHWKLPICKDCYDLSINQ